MFKVARNMKAYMETMGRCNSCVRWKMASAETKTASVVTKLDVGFWTPAGPYLKDDLFPHIKGSFRGRSIPVSSVHVKSYCNINIVIFNNLP